jgi:hypothetical protein
MPSSLYLRLDLTRREGAEFQLADEFLYLETIGRRTGLPRTIEIWFVERGGSYFVVSEGRAASAWVRNIADNRSVSFSVGTGEERERVLPKQPAVARAVDSTLEPELAGAVSILMNAKYGWSNGLIVELAPLRSL